MKCFYNGKTSKELLKELVNSRYFMSTTDIMNSMKELFIDVLQTVMETELEEKLGCEKSKRVSNTSKDSVSKITGTDTRKRQ